MSLYRYKEKGPAFGLGHTEGELVAYDEKESIEASCLVPVVDKEGRALGRQALVKKNYSVEYLVDSGVIALANEKDRDRFKAGDHINAKADKVATLRAQLESSQVQARKERMK